MELEQIRNKWQTSATPTYSREEVESIFQIKQSNILGGFKSMLKADLIVAEVIAIGFIITLQFLDLRTSNFWSLVMAFIGVQHLFIYLLQSVFIRRMSRFTGNVATSIESSIAKLTTLRWLYRTVPSILGILLFTFYVNRFETPLTTNELFLVGIGIATAILVISETLSSVIVKSQIHNLRAIKSGMQEVADS